MELRVDRKALQPNSTRASPWRMRKDCNGPSNELDLYSDDPRCVDSSWLEQ